MPPKQGARMGCASYIHPRDLQFPQAPSESQGVGLCLWGYAMFASAPPNTTAISSRTPGMQNRNARDSKKS